MIRCTVRAKANDTRVLKRTIKYSYNIGKGKGKGKAIPARGRGGP
jgi:hypothetical protein